MRRSQYIGPPLCRRLDDSALIENHEQLQARLRKQVMAEVLVVSGEPASPERQLLREPM